MTKQKSVKITAVFLTICLLVSGCSAIPFLPTFPTAPQPTASGQPTIPTQPQQTTAPTETQPVALSPLELLRKEMEATAQDFAVAYLGKLDNSSDSTLTTWIQTNSPEFYAAYPFVGEIGQVGNMGEIYCIVPRDPNATVAVNGLSFDSQWEPQYVDVLYRRESGDPVLLLCDNDVYVSSMQVTVTNSDGSSTTWYPYLNDALCVDLLRDGNYIPLIMDFSPYTELLRSDYHTRVASGWELPSSSDLIGTTWEWWGDIPDDRFVECKLTFGEGSLSVDWTDGYGNLNNFPNAAWMLQWEDDVAVLTIDFREFAGIRTYNVLVRWEDSLLYTVADFTSGEAALGEEPAYRFLGRTGYALHRPVDMVGSWDRVWSEMEGCRDESIPGRCTIEITGTNDNDLLISYTNLDFPEYNYQGKQLTVQSELVYYDCGNNAWSVLVNYVGKNDTTFTLTLRDDGYLLLRNDFQLDGYPAISYECFQRIP